MKTFAGRTPPLTRTIEQEEMIWVAAGSDTGVEIPSFSLTGQEVPPLLPTSTCDEGTVR